MRTFTVLLKCIYEDDSSLAQPNNQTLYTLCRCGRMHIQYNVNVLSTEVDCYMISYTVNHSHRYTICRNNGLKSKILAQLYVNHVFQSIVLIHQLQHSTHRDTEKNPAKQSWAFNIQIQSQNTGDQTGELEHNHLHRHYCIYKYHRTRMYTIQHATNSEPSASNI